MSSESANYERGLIGAVAMAPGETVVLAVRSGVTAEWFDDPRWRLAWCAALSLWHRDSTAAFDATLMLAEANRLVAAHPKEYAAELTANDMADAVDACPIPEAAGGYILQLKSALIVRQMRKVIAETFKVSDKVDAETACEDLVRRLLELLSRTVVARTASFADIVQSTVAKMREAHQIRMVDGRMDYVPGIPCPWWALTEILNGLLAGFHIIGARTSVGKTSFALQLVRYFAERGKCVAFDSLDMATQSFVGRFVAEGSRVSLFKANFGYTSNEDMERIENAAKTVSAWPVDVLVEYDVDRLFNWCRVRKAAGKLDIMFIDFVQLLSYRGADRATDTGRMTRVSKTIKRIVNELDIPVIGLSQLNRDCERDGGREPTKADLRESGALEQDATTVMLLFKDQSVAATFAAEAEDGRGTVMALAAGNKYLAKMITPIFLKVDKNQNGGLGRLPFVVYPNYFTWMLGDHNAQAIKTETGIGATKKTVLDFKPMFSRVHSDWRKSDFEADLRRYGVLLDEDAPPPNPQRAAPPPPTPTAPPPPTPTAPPPPSLYDDASDDDYFDPAEDLAGLTI